MGICAPVGVPISTRRNSSTLSLKSRLYRTFTGYRSRPSTFSATISPPIYGNLRAGGRANQHAPQFLDVVPKVAVIPDIHRIPLAALDVFSDHFAADLWESARRWACQSARAAIPRRCP